MSQSGIERRQHSRFPIAIQYRLVIAGTEHTGVTGNLSLSGAYLASVDPPFTSAHAGQSGTLAFDTTSEVISIDCRVVYVGSKSENDPFPGGAGIIFTDPSEAAITAIWNLSIEHLMRG